MCHNQLTYGDGNVVPGTNRVKPIDDASETIPEAKYLLSICINFLSNKTKQQQKNRKYYQVIFGFGVEVGNLLKIIFLTNIMSQYWCMIIIIIITTIGTIVILCLIRIIC